MKNANSKQSGFTLLELVMVITILAIMTGVVVPNLRPMMEGTALKRSATVLADLLRFARSSAIQNSQKTRVDFPMMQVEGGMAGMNNSQSQPQSTWQSNQNNQSNTNQQSTGSQANQNNQTGTAQASQRAVEYRVEQNPMQQPGVYTAQELPIHIPEEMGDLVTVHSISKQSLSGSLENNAVTFNPDGSTADTFIYLTDDQGQTFYTVGIVGLTGQIMIWDQRVESFYVE